MANEARILGVPTVVQTEGLTFLLNQRVGKLLYDASTVSLEFLKQALMDSSIKKYYMKFASGGVQINLGKADLLSASIYLPPFEAQLQYASRVESIYRAKAAHQTALAELEALFASLQTRAFPTGIGSPKELSNVRV
jgi:type I restriction enzyme S subunit